MRMSKVSILHEVSKYFDEMPKYDNKNIRRMWQYINRDI